MFDQITSEKLKFYVYCLIDPRDEKPFYIGKGKENRVFEHARSSIKNELNSDKLEKIREIRSNGLKVKHIIIRHGLVRMKHLKLSLP